MSPPSTSRHPSGADSGTPDGEANHKRRPTPNWRVRLYLWAAERLYRELAWLYDVIAWLVSLGRWDAWRRQALEHVRGPKVLEVGFGTGELLLEMARRGWWAVGLEPSPTMQRVTARKVARRGVPLHRVQALAQAMPFPDRTFDTVVATFPSGYIVAPDTLREVTRCLRPPNPAGSDEGGRLVIVGLYLRLHHPLLNGLVHLLFGRHPAGATARCQDLLAEAGFQVTEVDHPARWASAPVLVATRKARSGS